MSARGMGLFGRVKYSQLRFFATAEKGGKGAKAAGNAKKKGQQGAGESSKSTVEALQKFIDTAEAAKRYPKPPCN
jgi:hypothetical protein